MSYIALVLDDTSSAELLSQVPPIYENVYAHHVTLKFSPTHEDIKKFAYMLDTDVEFDVIGYAQNVDAQAVLVDQADGLFDEIKHPHITISTVNGVPPKDSVRAIEQVGHNFVRLGFTLSGTIEYIP